MLQPGGDWRPEAAAVTAHTRPDSRRRRGQRKPGPAPTRPRGDSPPAHTCLAFPSSCPYCPPLSFPLRLNRSHRKSIFLSPPRAATRQGTAGPGTALTRRLELLTQVLTRVGVTCHRLLGSQLVEALVWVSGHLAPRWRPSQVGEDMP